MQTKLLIVIYYNVSSCQLYLSPCTRNTWSLINLFFFKFPGTSPGTYIGLDLQSRLYLGGMDPDGRLPDDVDVQSGFHGCIAEVSNKERNTVEWF